MSAKQRKLIVFRPDTSDDQVLRDLEHVRELFPDFDWFGTQRIERVYGFPPEAPDGRIPDIGSDFVRGSG